VAKATGNYEYWAKAPLTPMDFSPMNALRVGWHKSQHNKKIHPYIELRCFRCSSDLVQIQLWYYGGADDAEGVEYETLVRRSQ
jgi:hypothetical protein